MAIKIANRIIDSRHPLYLETQIDWEKWRLTYRGGETFKRRYLKHFSTYEDKDDFNNRFDLTPVPGFGKAAINDIRNSIFQRMRDITRIGGSKPYREAIAGENGGVDRRGSTMNSFLGVNCLEELLVMGMVGIYIDNPVVAGNTLADSRTSRPYVYSYKREDILSWNCSKPEDPSEFQSVLLRDTCVNYDQATLLPIGTVQRFRLMWIDAETGYVKVQFYNEAGEPVTREGIPSLGPETLNLTRIPFILVDIGDSLIKDVCDHQIALLNLVSRDVWYAIQANFPFYIEQRDLRGAGAHLKTPSGAQGTATTGGQPATDGNIKVGTMQGRAYDKEAEAPAFINPSAEPLRVSMELQEKLEGDIRKLVNLAVINFGSRQSGEAKKEDNAGLEAGLSAIGLVLEGAERLIADHWAAYENVNPARRQIATIKYPDRYSLKTDTDRIDESTKLSKLMYSIPGRKVKREIAKVIVHTLFNGRVEVGVIDAINQEIDSANHLTSDPDTIIAAHRDGLVGDQSASVALGFSDNEHLSARQDHEDRIKRIAEAQGINKGDSDPGARGVNDLSADPDAARREREEANDPTLRDSTRRRSRGRSRKAPVRGASNKE